MQLVELRVMSTMVDR